MDEEYRRSIMGKKCLIMPGNRIKQWWDILIIYHLIYTALIVPYRVSFEEKSSDFLFYYDCWMDLCFLTDIVLTFFTAIKLDNNKICTDKSQIAKSYLKIWFWIDLVTSMPVQIYDRIIMSEMETSDIKSVKILRLSRISKLVRLLKMLRVLKVLLISSKLKRVMQGSGGKG